MDSRLELAETVTDVQRPTPPLTNEELAALGLWAKTLRRDQHIPTDRVLRLIADLRASRERIKELEAKLAWVDERIDSGEL